MVLEEVVKEERQNGKEFAQEIKDETKREMLEYLKVKQEVRDRLFSGLTVFNILTNGYFVVIAVYLFFVAFFPY